LKEYIRDGRTSRTNALVAIVIPDQENNYSYYTQYKRCCFAGCMLFSIDNVFQIIAKNMFNTKVPSYMACKSGERIFEGPSSYIHTVTWSDFKMNPDLHLGIATEINNNISNYNLVKSVN
jgi:hypothetical protein